MRTVIGGLALAAVLAAPPPRQSPAARDTSPRSVILADLTWPEAAQVLTPETVVLVPVGAAAKEHGPHLKLRNDLALAEYLTRQVAAQTPVVVAPALQYHFYPAFLEYPGSVSLSLATARDMTSDVIRSLARYGPRRFYVLNTGISTNRPLTASADALRAEGILMQFTNLQARLEPMARAIRRQEGGSHADEIETSLMLHIDPGLVEMSKAVKDFSPASTPFTLTRTPGARGTYSPSGVWGDATLATPEKGRLLADTLIAGIVDDVARLRSTPLPDAAAPEAAQQPRPPGATGNRPGPHEPGQCSSGDERSIRGLGMAYTAHWANLDAERLSNLWAELGDMAHPDGTVERMRKNIFVNRLELFRRREYRSSRHFLQLGVVRCLSDDVAMADGKWELRDVTDAEGRIQPAFKGLVTLVVKRYGGAWLIEGYRYTIDSPEQRGPTLLKRPGYPGRGGLR